MTRQRTVKLTLPVEFIELCKRDQVASEVVLRGFIADLCGLISWANKQRQRSLAWQS